MADFFTDLAKAFTGSGARDDINAGAGLAKDELNEGMNQALGDYARAGSRFDAFKGYTDAGTASAKRYADSLGVNGVDAQRTVQNEYMGDPIQNALMDRIQRSNTRAAVASGFNNSGAATQSLTNALLQNWGQYQTALKGGADMGQLGFQAATGQAGADQMQGDAKISTFNQRAAVTTGQANANAATRAAPLNNLLNIASLGVQAATGKPATRYGTA